MYPGKAVSMSNNGSKSYPYLSLYKTVILDHSIIIEPKSTRVFSIEPPNLVFRKRTSFKFDKTLEQKGIYTYNCLREEKSIPIICNNLPDQKNLIPKGSLGDTNENIEMNSKPKYSASDNTLLLNNDEEFNQVFHMSEQLKTQLIQDNDPSELPKAEEEKQKK